MTKTLTRAIDLAQQAVHGLRAVDYLRVSTEEQTKGYGITYTSKRTANHIRKKGWEHVGTFADEGFSGSLDHTQRPHLKRLMAEARQIPRPFDVVVVHEERAIGRRDRAFWPWVWKLEDLGIFVAVVRGDYDNTSEEGRSRMRKEQDRAEDERVTIRDRTQGGVQEKAEIGGHPGGVASYGYRIENKGVKGESRIVLDTGDAHEGYPTLHRAFRYIVEDEMTPPEVEAIFNAERVPGPSLDYWPRGSLRHVLTSQAIQDSVRIFRNPRGPKVRLDANGNPLFGETVSIALEPVFTKTQLERLNKALARTSGGPRTKEAAVYPLSQHIISTCGRSRTGVSNIGNDKGRAYRCTGKTPQGTGATKCDCAQIDAAALESRVWSETCRMLEDPDRLRQMAQDWVEMAESSGVDYGARVKELNELIEEQEDTIYATTEATARRARRKGLDKEAAQEAIGRATRDLESKLADLEKLRDEALAWQADMQRDIDRAHDLGRLADMARVRLHSMNARQQEDIMDLLDLRVTILGEAPRRTRRDDQISAWFRGRERVVPDLTDDAWGLVEPVLKARKGRRPADARGLLDALFTKARTGCAWNDLKYGNVASIWARWLKSGLWDDLMEALAQAPGEPVRDAITLPPLRVEGRIDPRLFIGEDQSPDHEDQFKSSDYKISPFELESALLEHEAVAEAAVVPAPDPVRLAVPKAYVALAEGWEPGADTAKLLFEHARSVLAPYQRIRRIEFAELPKTVSGKIRRIELHERTAKGSDAEYDEGDLR